MSNLARCTTVAHPLLALGCSTFTSVISETYQLGRTTEAESGAELLNGRENGGRTDPFSKVLRSRLFYPPINGRSTNEINAHRVEQPLLAKVAHPPVRRWK